MTHDDISTILNRAHALRRDYIRAWVASLFSQKKRAGFHGTVSAEAS